MITLLYSEYYTNGISSPLLIIVSLISVSFGISIIISKNPIVSVLFLIFLFSSISIYLISIGMYFIGISYLLVYVGAVSILFIFILMLINIRISELLSATGNSIPLGIFISISFFFPLSYVLSYNIGLYAYDAIYWIFYFIIDNSVFKGVKQYIYYATSKIWDGALAETTDITSLGNIMYSSYSIWLLLTSLILLLAMVGAITITVK